MADFLRVAVVLTPESFDKIGWSFPFSPEFESCCVRCQHSKDHGFKLNIECLEVGGFVALDVVRDCAYFEEKAP